MIKDIHHKKKYLLPFQFWLYSLIHSFILRTQLLRFWVAGGKGLGLAISW